MNPTLSPKIHSGKFRYFTFQVIKQGFALLEFSLFLRFIFKLLGANPKTLVVDLLYIYSDFLIYPFKNIFPNFFLFNQYLVDMVTISAMIGYVVAVFVIFQVVKIFLKD
ncbi:MAG: hypothetical protein ABH889_02970, partial [Candidatus Portnoybacteria bacterium]